MLIGMICVTASAPRLVEHVMERYVTSLALGLPQGGVPLPGSGSSGLRAHPAAQASGGRTALLRSFRCVMSIGGLDGLAPSSGGPSAVGSGVRPWPRMLMGFILNF